MSMTRITSAERLSHFTYTPEADEYVYFVLSGFSGVSTAEEMAETVILYGGNGKGYYRHTDLNRVQAAVAYLRGILAAYGYDAVPAYTLPSWSENDVPRRDDMDSYIRAIRSYAPCGFRTAGECEMYQQHFLCYEKEL